MDAAHSWLIAGAVAGSLGIAACGGTPSSDSDAAAGPTGGAGTHDGAGGGFTSGSGGAAIGASGGGPGGGGDCASLGAPIDPAALATTVELFASDALAGRAPGTAGDETARAYIEAQFGCIGLTPAGAGASYQTPFVTSTGVTTANVVGYVAGADPALGSEIVLVGAHHDHLGTTGGEIHPGANDNASGVAAMLEMARALRARAAPPKRTVAFVAFGFEEHDGDCEGSEHFAAHPPQALPVDRIVYTVVTDMVGVYPLEQKLTAYGSFAGTPGRALLDGLAGSHPGLALDLGVAADEDASDFQAFFDRGIPYVYFETWDEPCWHQPCDTADRIDYSSMAEIASLGAELVAQLADTDADLAGGVQPMSSSGP